MLLIPLVFLLQISHPTLWLFCLEEFRQKFQGSQVMFHLKMKHLENLLQQVVALISCTNYVLAADIFFKDISSLHTLGGRDRGGAC